LALQKMNDTPKLKSHQKRAMFRARFGTLLTNCGFEYRKNRFLRFHEGQLLLSVGMELSRAGEMDIVFGGMPLCAENFRPDLPCGEKIADFGGIYPLAGNFRQLAFEDQLEAQAELFEKYLLESFSEIDRIGALLDFQERMLEDRLSMMPVDFAVWECVYLRDYEKALRYAMIWQEIEKKRAEERSGRERAAIMAEDLNRHDREIRLRDHGYRDKCRTRWLCEAQRIACLLEAGAYPLLHENIERNIDAATAAFYKYLSKE